MTTSTYDVVLLLNSLVIASLVIASFRFIYSFGISYIKSRDFVKQQMHNVGFSGLDMLKFNTVEEVGTVKSVDGMFATVMLPKKSTCEGCSLGTCKQAEQSMEIVALNNANAHAGQKVRITIKPYAYLKGSLLVYGIPALALVIGAIAGKEVFGHFFHNLDPDMASALFGFGAFIISFLFLKMWSTNAEKKTVSKPVVEEILEE